MTLEELIRDASHRAALTLKQLGGVPITFIGYRADHNPGFMFDQETLTLSSEGAGLNSDQINDKDFLRQLAKTFIMLFGCTQVVMYAEAWKAALPKDKKSKVWMKEGIANHPDREEIVHYMAEDYDGNSWLGMQTLIRPAGFPPYLDTLEIHEARDSIGRFTHFFKRAQSAR